MQPHKPIFFIFQAVTVGLAIAFLILLVRPELFNEGQKAVTFIESTRSVERSGLGAGPVSYSAAVDTAAPAVVNVYTRKTVKAQSNPLFNDPLFRQFFGDAFSLPQREREETSLGSGVIVSPQGYLLTNNHVIEGADEIQVALHDGRTAEAKLIGADAEADIAVLSVDLDDLPAITLGQSDALRVGDVVLAIGNPFGVGQTVTMGIVSATGRSELGISTFENFIQTDAAINPGNSGGALINARGELVGINTAIFTRSGGSQGIGFAIPVSLARTSMSQIVEHGRVRRGWLAIEIQELDPALAESFGLGRDGKGVVVTSVLRDGPAGKVGVSPGDIVQEVAGKAVTTVREALNAIATNPPGTRITLRGIRNGKPLSVEVEVGERPPQQPRS